MTPRAQPAPDPKRKPLVPVTIRRKGGTTRAQMAELFRADPHDDSVNDFPMPVPPPYPADDENEETPHDH